MLCEVLLVLVRTHLALDDPVTSVTGRVFFVPFLLVLALSPPPFCILLLDLQSCLFVLIEVWHMI